MDSRMLVKPQNESHPPGVGHALVLVASWILLTGFVESVLFMFWFTGTIAVFSVAGAPLTLVGIIFAVMALAVAPLGCAYIVRRTDRWLHADRWTN